MYTSNYSELKSLGTYSVDGLPQEMLAWKYDKVSIFSQLPFLQKCHKCLTMNLYACKNVFCGIIQFMRGKLAWLVDNSIVLSIYLKRNKKKARVLISRSLLFCLSVSPALPICLSVRFLISAYLSLWYVFIGTLFMQIKHVVHSIRISVVCMFSCFFKTPLLINILNFF